MSNTVDRLQHVVYIVRENLLEPVIILGFNQIFGFILKYASFASENRCVSLQKRGASYFFERQRLDLISTSHR